MIPNNKEAGFLGAVEFFLFMLLVAFIVIVVRTCEDFSLESKVKEDIADISSYRATIQAFKTKYIQLPGDYAKAKDTWPESNSGNGNGYWEGTESAEVFKQLTLADMIEMREGVIFPRLLSTEQSVFPIGNFDEKSSALMGDIFSGYMFPTNSFMLYFEEAATGNMMPTQKRVEHEAVYMIDEKMDDGNAVEGDMRVAFNNPSFFGFGSKNEICAYSNGKYRIDESNKLFCNFILKY